MRIEDRLREMGEHKIDLEQPSRQDWDRFLNRGHRRLARRRVGAALAAAAIIVLSVQVSGSLLDQVASPTPPAGNDDSRATDNRSVDDGVRSALPMQIWYTRDGFLYPSYEFVQPEGVTAGEAAAMEVALERVLAGPSAEGAVSDAGTAFPEGARLHRLELGPRSRVYLSGFSTELSPASRRLALAQIAATVLEYDFVQYEDVHSVVVFEDDASVTPEPLTEASFEPLLPPIMVNHPPNFPQPAAFSDNLMLRGTADVFEANVVYELIGRDGTVIADGFTTATCGSGCRGDFSARIEFEVARPTPASLNVYSPSAEDGSRMFEVSVPVLLCPRPGPQFGCGEAL